MKRKTQAEVNAKHFVDAYRDAGLFWLQVYRSWSLAARRMVLLSWKL